MESVYVVCKKDSPEVFIGSYSTLSEARRICSKKNKKDCYSGPYGVFEAIGNYREYLLQQK